MVAAGPLLVLPLSAQSPSVAGSPSGVEAAPPAPNPPTAPQAPSAPEASPGRFITDQGATQFRASKFVGLSVYSPDNQRVGDINEILIDEAGAAQGAVIGVGGFLGIGEKTIAVPFSALEWVKTRPPVIGASGTGVIGSAVTAVTGAASTVRAATSEVTAAARTPAETAAFNGYPDHAVLRIPKSELQSAPTFRYYAETHPVATTSPNATTVPAGSAPKR